MAVESKGRTELRTRILAAAARVVADAGVAGARTSAIAAAAGCAEGSIYRYFPSKRRLLHEAVCAQLPQLDPLLRTFPDRAGTATVAANLREGARVAAGFFDRLVPLAAGVLGDPELRSDGCGLFDTRRAAACVAAYLDAERRLGRVRRDLDVDAAARALLDGCLGASLARFLGGGEPYDRSAVAEVLVTGVEPR